LGVKCLRLKNE